ncbi:30S ribosomal protein S13 [bacterium]|nr:30S ribosomal protein S13 [bacterium]MBQ5492411.1 30S ribosomal protein S13 [Mycoplasmataceae bacterium]MBO6022704.1 30S ribosomal protein S13 [bacterium]MBO6042779.1 30S ribosomal protein S13 [bacterium]MBO6072495.1 30S ribosomal protein S13 [bacterium]
MARILGVDIPNRKALRISLTAIYGIGNTTANKICEIAKIDPNKKVEELSDKELGDIRSAIDKLKSDENLLIEGDLRKKVSLAIKNEMEIGSYRGIRHRRNLPVRGQRTRTNARTRKGPRKTVANKKIESKN